MREKIPVKVTNSSRSRKHMHEGERDITDLLIELIINVSQTKQCWIKKPWDKCGTYARGPVLPWLHYSYSVYYSKKKKMNNRITKMV